MSYLLKYGYGIRSFYRILPQIKQAGEQFINIGHIEIPCQHQIPRHPVVGTQHGMQILNIVFTKSPITQMPQEKFTGKSSLGF
ncbi:hypothetical protein DSECCO2_607390 [anaerobic digester metagenome]